MEHTNVLKSAPTPLAKGRIQSIDFLRGLIMVIMALDHTRDFFHITAFTANPLDPATSYPVLYFTRWITHFCAPAFVFLSGLSAWLQGQRKTKKELRRFLIIRGIWLILFDLTIMTFIMTLDVHFEIFILETLWSIGAGMILLGLLLNLPFRYILTIGLIIFLDITCWIRPNNLQKASYRFGGHCCTASPLCRYGAATNCLFFIHFFPGLV